MTQKYHAWKVGDKVIDLNQTKTVMKTNTVRTKDANGKDVFKQIEVPVQEPAIPKSTAELIERNFQQLTTTLPDLIRAVESEPVGTEEYHIDPGGAGSVTVRPRGCKEGHEYQFGPASWTKPLCPECKAEFDLGIKRSPAYFQKRDLTAKPSLTDRILGRAPTEAISDEPDVDAPPGTPADAPPPTKGGRRR